MTADSSLLSLSQFKFMLSLVVAISIAALHLIIFLSWLCIALLYLGHIANFSRHVVDRANTCAAALQALPANGWWAGVILR